MEEEPLDAVDRALLATRKPRATDCLTNDEINIITTLAKHATWAEGFRACVELGFISEEVNAKEHCRNRGLLEKAKKLREDAMNLAVSENLQAQTLMASQVLDKEVAIGASLARQLERITFVLDDAIPGSKVYSNALTSLLKCKEALDKLSGLHRLREQQDIIDKAELSLKFYEEKLKLNQKFGLGKENEPQQINTPEIDDHDLIV